MNLESYVDFILQFIQFAVVPAIWSGVYVLRDIRRQLAELNGRIIRLEQWSDGHEKLDAERFEDVTERLDQLREDMHRSGVSLGRSRR